MRGEVATGERIDAGACPAKPVVWMFSGQGSQYFHMGKDLYEAEPVFRRAMDTCDEILEPLLGLRLCEVIYAPRADRFQPFDDTRQSSPAICALQYGVARLLQSRGHAPDMVLGYSLGEVTAGVVAGALALEDGLRIAVKIADLLAEDAAAGAMLAILGDVAMTERHPDWFAGTWVAARNFDGHFVVSGPPRAVTEIEARLKAENLSFQRLPVEFAFHSPLIEPIGERFRAFVRSLAVAPAAIDMVSGSDGRIFRTLTGDSLWTTIRQPVPFGAALARLEARGAHRYVDLGPAGTMGTFVKYGLAAGSGSEIATTVTPFRGARANLERFFPIR